MSAATVHRLDGLESDNLLAFLALIGLLRALETCDRDQSEDRSFLPRAAWDLDRLPLRPTLILARHTTQEEVAAAATRGIDSLAVTHEFDGSKNLNYSLEQCRGILETEARNASLESHERLDLFGALMTDGALKDEKNKLVQPTPLCLLYGQGHQHFLDRLAEVPRLPAPPARGTGKSKKTITAEECLIEALFQPWQRTDPTFSFRWDLDEDVRYALMPGDPTDAAYKTGTQHGANRLAAVGLAALTLAPSRQAGRVRAAVIGGEFRDGFSFAWPVWRDPASLPAIRALLAHPALRRPGGLDHLGVEHVFVARRISVGKFMNFSRGRPLSLATETVQGRRLAEMY